MGVVHKHVGQGALAKELGMDSHDWQGLYKASTMYKPCMKAMLKHVGQGAVAKELGTLDSHDWQGLNTVKGFYMHGRRFLHAWLPWIT